MDEQATFEPRAVLAPRRARLTRLALLLPAVALVAIAWAGFSGARTDEATAEVPVPTAAVTRSPQYPAQVVGLDVQRLDDVQPRWLDRDDVIAIAGWYVATAITDCPPLDAIYRDGSLPEVRGDAGVLAFCERAGVLYASRPSLDKHENAGLRAVAATLAIGIVAPPELEIIGTVATEVVLIGRFVGSGDACRVHAGCRRDLVVDHVAWAPGF